MRLQTLRATDRPVSYTYDAASPAERVEPVTLAQVKAHLRFGSSSEDALITAYLQAARIMFEDVAGRAAIDQVREFALDQAPLDRVLELPRPPLKATGVVITYEDGDGATQTFSAANYRVLPSYIPTEDSNPSAIDPFCACGSIELAATASWPATNGAARSFRVRRTCGYGTTAAAMPGLLQGALYLLIAHWHRNRAEVQSPELSQIPLGARAMLSAFQLSALPTRNPRAWVCEDATVAWRLP